MRPVLLVSILFVVTLASGCMDNRPSEGRCTGTLRGEAVDLSMDAAASEYHRDDDLFLDDDAPFAMSYGDGELAILGELDDMPTSSDVGVHDTSGELFHFFDANVARGEGPTAVSSTMTIESVRIDRMTGAVDATFDDGGALHCTFDLRRAFELDTDD
jgi:hypothetical protein